MGKMLRGRCFWVRFHLLFPEDVHCKYFSVANVFDSDTSLPISRIPLLAAIGGSMVTRTASRLAFTKQGRGLVTEDMLREVATAFAEVFGEESQGQNRGRL